MANIPVGEKGGRENTYTVPKIIYTNFRASYLGSLEI
jgi:hypothetical protein